MQTATEVKRNFTLKNSVILRIRKDKRLRAKLVLELDTTSTTLYRWLKNNDFRLTTSLFLNIVSQHTGLPVLDLTEEVVEPIEV